MDKAVTAAVSVESVEAGSVVEIEVEATDTIEASVLTVGTVEKGTSDVNFVAAVTTTPPLTGKQRQS